MGRPFISQTYTYLHQRVLALSHTHHAIRGYRILLSSQLTPSATAISEMPRYPQHHDAPRLASKSLQNRNYLLSEITTNDLVAQLKRLVQQP